MSESCYIIAIFPIYGQFEALRKPDSRRIVCKIMRHFQMKITKTENGTGKTLLQFSKCSLNPIWTGLLRGSSGPGGGVDLAPPPQYLGLYLSVANQTWQIYKTN